MSAKDSQHTQKHSVSIFQLFLLQLAVHFFDVDVTLEQKKDLERLKTKESRKKIIRLLLKIPLVPLVLVYFSLEYWVKYIFNMKK